MSLPRQLSNTKSTIGTWSFDARIGQWIPGKVLHHPVLPCLPRELQCLQEESSSKEEMEKFTIGPDDNGHGLLYEEGDVREDLFKEENLLDGDDDLKDHQENLLNEKDSKLPGKKIFKIFNTDALKGESGGGKVPLSSVSSVFHKEEESGSHVELWDKVERFVIGEDRSEESPKEAQEASEDTSKEDLHLKFSSLKEKKSFKKPPRNKVEKPASESLESSRDIFTLKIPEKRDSEEEEVFSMSESDRKKTKMLKHANQLLREVDCKICSSELMESEEIGMVVVDNSPSKGSSRRSSRDEGRFKSPRRDRSKEISRRLGDDSFASQKSGSSQRMSPAGSCATSKRSYSGIGSAGSRKMALLRSFGDQGEPKRVPTYKVVLISSFPASASAAEPSGTTKRNSARKTLGWATCLLFGDKPSMYVQKLKNIHKFMTH